MPFALVLIGLIMIISGVKNTQSMLGQQLVKDFTGSGNFVYWIVSIFVVGSLGYIPGFEKFSRAFMALIVLTLFLANGGFFQQFTQALQGGTAQAPPPGPAVTLNTETPESSSSGGGGDTSSIASIAEVAAIA